jgi:hypothetical protein
MRRMDGSGTFPQPGLAMERIQTFRMGVSSIYMNTAQNRVIITAYVDAFNRGDEADEERRAQDPPGHRSASFVRPYSTEV